MPRGMDVFDQVENEVASCRLDIPNLVESYYLVQVLIMISSKRRDCISGIMKYPW